MGWNIIGRQRSSWHSLPLGEGASAGRALACRDAHGMATIQFDGLVLTGTGFLTLAPTGLIPAGPAGSFATGRAHIDPVPSGFVDVRVYRYGVQLHVPTSALAGKVLYGQFSYRTDDTGPLAGVKL